MLFRSSRELTEYYNAGISGREARLQDLLVQYADYSEWQREWLRGEVLEKQLSYWQERLLDAPKESTFPTDKTRPQHQRYQGATISFQMRDSIFKGLKKLAKNEGVTLYMLLLSAFEVLLYRYTEQEDLIIGTAVTNRSHVEVEALIGFFVNTLVLRTKVSSNMIFTKLLAQIKEAVLEAYAHQDVPFEHVLENLRIMRDIAHQSLFQIMFIFQEMPVINLNLHGITTSYHEVDLGVSKFDLTLWMEETALGINGILEYNTDLYTQESMQRLLERFNIVLEQLFENSKKSIANLTLFSDKELHFLSDRWIHRSVLPEAEPKSIVQIIEEYAIATPDATAIIFENRQLSYKDLNIHANQMAYYLVQNGVSSETLVGVFLEPSLELIIGLLGILKAGGTYLPLDQTSTKERISFILKDAQVELVLTQETLTKHIPSQKISIICVDTNWELIKECKQTNLSTVINKDNLAYILYPSSHIGKHVGVGVTHANVVDIIKSLNMEYKFKNDDVWVLFHSYVFGFAAFKIWGSLLHGGTLLIPDYWTVRTTNLFYELIKKHKGQFLVKLPQHSNNLFHMQIIIMMHLLCER